MSFSLVSNVESVHLQTPNMLNIDVSQLDVCHARMHGLTHDGRLQACQSDLLRLMYGCRVNVRS
jgi:hypothetical protein